MVKKTTTTKHKQKEHTQEENCESVVTQHPHDMAISVS